MSAPLPKVYEDAGNGSAQPAPVQTPGAIGPIGGDFKVDELQRVAKETVRPAAGTTLHCSCSSMVPSRQPGPSICRHHE